MKNEWTVVFDLDGSLETPYFDKSDAEKVKTWIAEHPCGNTFDRMYAEVMDGLPHFFLNGALELLRWVHDQGFEIVFFSNAVVERNRELCPIIMERAFGKGKEPPYRVLSRGDCVDTAHMDDEEGRALHSGQDFHLPFYFCGMLKRIVAHATKAKVSLAEAAVQVQYADYGFLFPLDGNRLVRSDGGQVRIPEPPQDGLR